MRAIIFTLIKIALLMAMIIIFLFLWVDGKIENEKLQLRTYLLSEQIEELTAERDLMREAYQDAILQWLEEGKLSLTNLQSMLPPGEIKHLIARQGKQDELRD